MVLDMFQRHVILWSMFAFISAYQIGYGPLTWTVLSEIYPSEIRGRAMAVSVEVNFLGKFACQLFFPILQGWLGWGQTFVLFAIIVIVSLVFIGTCVPETKGMSLEEIQVQMKLLHGKTPPEQSARNKSIILYPGNYVGPDAASFSSDDSKRNPLLVHDSSSISSKHSDSHQKGLLTPIV